MNDAYDTAMKRPIQDDSAYLVERDEFSEFRWTGFLEKMDQAMDLLWAVLPYVAFFAAGVAFAAALRLL